MDGLFLVDAIGPFFVGNQQRRINWSKTPFQELEREGGLHPERFQQIREDFETVCKRVKRLGYTAVTLDDVAHLADHGAYSASVRQLIRDYTTLFDPLFRIAEEQQLEVFLTMDVLSLTPCLDAWINDDFERSLNFMQQSLSGLFQRFPTLQGVIVRMGECDGNDVRGIFNSRLHLTTPERARRFLQRLLPLFERLGKTLIFRTWTVGAHPIGDLIWNRETFRAVFDEVHSTALVISMKYGESDFFRHLPISKHFFRSDHQKLVELQARREYEGCGEYPSYVGGDYERIHRDLAAAKNMVGISVWAQTGGWTGFRRLTFLQPEGIWNEINVHTCIRIFREGLSAEASIRDWCEHQWSTPTDPDRWIELLRLSEEAVKELLYLPDFAGQKLYFRRVRVPQQLSVYWDHVFVNHAVRKISRHFVRDPESSVQQGYNALRKIQRMEVLAEELGLPADDVTFMKETFHVIAEARAYALGPWSEKLIENLEAAKEGYKKTYPRGSRHRYAIRLDFRRMRISRRRLRWFLKVLVREQRGYRIIDQVVTLHLLSYIYPLLKIFSRRKKEGFLETQAMGFDSVLR